MNFVDLLLIACLVLVAIIGWRAGLIATALGFAGFLVGAVAGAFLTPMLLSGHDLPTVLNTLLVLLAMVLMGLVGQSLFGWLGRSLRDAIPFRPIRFLDSAGGLGVSALAFLLSAWLLLSVVASLPVAGPVTQVRDSRSYLALEEIMAGPTGGLLEQVRGLLATLDLPKIPFNEALLPPVADPSELDVASQARQVAVDSVVAVAATATRCSRSSTGSAVVVGPQRVATNAHVVAGAERISVQVSGRGPRLSARPIYIDRSLDIAILFAPDLRAPVPQWVQTASRGTEAAVAGYPLGGPLRVRPAIVRGRATVPDDDGSGSREVYVFRGRVQPGNSGGALLDSAGRVIGLVFASAQDDQNTGFALTAQDVKPVIRETARSTQEVGTGACAK